MSDSDFSGLTNSTIQNAQQYATTAMDVQQKSAAMNQMQSNIQMAQDAMNMKKTLFHTDMLGKLSLMDEGPLKNALIQNYQKGAQSFGDKVPDTWIAATKDPSTRSAVNSIATSIGNLYSDPAMKPFFNSFPDLIKSGQVTTQELLDTADKFKQYEAMKAKNQFEVGKFGKEQEEKFGNNATEIEKRYAATLDPIDHSISAIPKKTDENDQPVLDSKGKVQPLFEKMGDADDAALAQNFTEMFDKQRLSAQAPQLLKSGESYLGKAQTFLNKVRGQGGLLDNDTRKGMFDIMMKIKDQASNAKRNELMRIANAVSQQGLNPHNVFTPDSMSLLAQPPMQTAPPNASMGQASPQVSQPQTSQNATPIAPKPFSPKVMSTQQMNRLRGKSRSEIESRLGQKIPDELADSLGLVK
jgi:hypothetical protein